MATSHSQQESSYLPSTVRPVGAVNRTGLNVVWLTNTNMLEASKLYRRVLLISTKMSKAAVFPLP
jgi:hypothetical protein